MTLYTDNIVPSSATDAAFRLWGSTLCSRLESLGFTKTADTGQIDWLTVSRANPGSGTGYTSAGYEIRQFTDSLQSTSPIYIKLTFGAAYQIVASNVATNVTLPMMTVQVGTSTNGAGTLSGNVTGAISISPTGGTATAVSASTCYISGSTAQGRLAVGMFINSAYAMYFSLERTRDASGNSTGQGSMLTVIGTYSAVTSNGNKNNHFIQNPNLGISTPTLVDTGFVFPTGITSGVDGITTVNLYPNLFNRGGTVLNYGINQLAYFSGDAVGGTTGTINIYGTNRTYYFVGTTPTGNFTTVGRGSVANTCLAMLVE